MKDIIIKLVKDFKKAKGKLLLMILASFLSAWGISSMVYSYYLAERDFEVNFLRTQPADMSITVTDTIGVSQKIIKDNPNVIGIERRGAVSARVKDRSGNWMPLLFFVIDDVEEIKYDRIVIPDSINQAGDQFYIEKNSTGFLTEDLSSLEVRFLNQDQSVIFNIDGLVHDARMAPSRMEGTIYAYASSFELVKKYLPANSFRYLVETSVSDSKEQIESVYQEIKASLLKEGIEVKGHSIPTPGEHMHQGIVDGIALMQRTGGIVLSAMGLILLSLILLTWIFPQIRDIGIMKAVGASTPNIASSYFVVLNNVISIGLLIGVPLGFQTAWKYNSWIAVLQNFETVDGPLSFSIHAQVILFCMLIPTLFAISPIATGTRTTVTQAINTTFFLPFKGNTDLTQEFNIKTGTRYIVNNLFRRMSRTFLTVILISLGFGIYYTATNMDYSIRQDLTEYVANSTYKIGLQLPEEMKLEQVDFVREVSYVKSFAPILTKRIAYYPPDGGERELSYLRSFSTKFSIAQSDLIRGELDLNCKNCLYAGGSKRNEEFKDVEIGDDFEITDMNGRVQKYRFMGSFKDMIIIKAPFFTFSTTDSSFNYLAIEVDNAIADDELYTVSNALDDAFLENGINLKSMVNARMRLSMIVNHLEPTFLIIRIMGYFTIFLGLIGMLIVLNLSIRERSREIGILKALGSSFGQISGMINREFLLMSCLAIIFGFLMAIPVTKMLLDMIASAIIGHKVQLLFDIKIMILASLILLTFQASIVLINNRFKLRKKTSELLGHSF